MPSSEPRQRLYNVPNIPRSLVLDWYRFKGFDDALAGFPSESVLYTLQSAHLDGRTSFYVGKATGLRRRYASARGALGALMSQSSTVLFVASVQEPLLKLVEHTIIFWDSPTYNARDKSTMPAPRVHLVHRFNGITEYSAGSDIPYEGPLFCRPGDLKDDYKDRLKS